jgi:hypothetical protein
MPLPKEESGNAPALIAIEPRPLPKEEIGKAPVLTATERRPRPEIQGAARVCNIGH